MNRWLTMIVLAVALVGCDRFQPARTPTQTSTPASLPTATGAPSETPLAPTLVLLPTDTSVPTATGAATSAATAAEPATLTTTPTATKAPVVIRPTSKPTTTNTVVALKYNAPVLVGPGAGDTRVDGKDDLLFIWKPAGDLGPNECYLVTVRVVNVVDPLQHFVQDSFTAQDTCNSAASSGNLEFTLRKRNPPSYQGMVAQAAQIGGPSSQFKVRWWVTVVSADGTPLSPPSAQFEFTLESP
jgi:hypothetical protein